MGVQDEMKRVAAELGDEGLRQQRLEAFMIAIAKELKCLPSFADPSPDGGNSHIMAKLRELTTLVDEGQ